MVDMALNKETKPNQTKPNHDTSFLLVSQALMRTLYAYDLSFASIVWTIKDSTRLICEENL